MSAMSLNRRIANHQATGLLGAFSAYLVWGLQQIYWKYFAGLDSWIVIAHRYCWSCVFLILVLFFSGKLELVRNTCVCLLTKKLDFLFLCLISILAVLNWGINIYAPMAGHVVELGMGLFLTPLMSVVLGVIFYRERLNLLQSLAVLSATVGVAIMLIHFGHFPWIALGVSSTWAVYGALKKKINLEPTVAIFLESILVLPFALAYLWCAGGGTFFAKLSHADMTVLALIGTGILTSAPLVAYTYATNYLALNLLGFCQYISPILTLVLGIFVYQESFGWEKIYPMLFVWLGIVLFIFGQRKIRRFRLSR